MEDQQASTVKGEEEVSPELNDEAAEVQDTELEASPEPAQADPESEGEASTSEEVVEIEIKSEADEEPESKMETAAIESEEAERASADSEAETEESMAEPEESESDEEEPVVEADEDETEVDEPVSEESQEDSSAEITDEPDEEQNAERNEEPVAVAETAAENVDEASTETGETVDTVEELEIAAVDGMALTELSPTEAPLNANDGQIAEELATEAKTDTPGRMVAEPDDGREWYVVHCYSGYENKVRHNLEQRIETMDMKGKIFDVVVPTEEEMEVKDGKRRTVERRVFPGYILVQMIMDEDSWYVVRNTPGVTGFVGMGNEPTALRPEEVSQIVKRMEADAPRIKVTYDVGQKVRIIDGPFNDFIGTVDDINMDKAKVRVMVSFFGRETPVELDFLQVEKA